jgi:signal peptidase I
MKHSRMTAPAWVGMVLGLFIPGSAHMASGARRAGGMWFFGLMGGTLLVLLLASIPGTIMGVATLLSMVGLLAAWGVMLVQSHRPVVLGGMYGIIAVAAASFVLLILLHAAAWQIVYPFRLASTGMAPTLQPRDIMLVDRLSARLGRPRRGDIVVFRAGPLADPRLRPDAYYVQRVAGLPGERIRIRPPHLLADGLPVTNHPVLHRIANREDGFQGFAPAPSEGGEPAFLTSSTSVLTLGSHEYFLIGDHTALSLDSRYFGPVPEEAIVGHVVRVLWPRRERP